MFVADRGTDALDLTLIVGEHDHGDVEPGRLTLRGEFAGIHVAHMRDW